MSGLADGSLELAEEEEPPAPPAPRRHRTHSQRLRTPENLDVVCEVIEPELVQAQPEHYQRIGQEVSRLLDYPVFAKDKAGVELFGCWAHARRGFFEAQEQAPQVAGWILKQIGILYRWEERLRQTRAGPMARKVFRASHHRMVVARLHRALNKLQSRYLPQSPMGQAISYAPNRWPALERFLEHGEVEIDNNLVENAIRPTAVGKKNWLFFGSEEAGQRSAVIYTLVANCRLHGVEPHAYLKDVLERLPTTTNQTVAQLTPLNWERAHQVPVKLAA